MRGGFKLNYIASKPESINSLASYIDSYAINNYTVASYN